MTQVEFENLRKECKSRLMEMTSKVDFARVSHQYGIVMDAFNNACDLTGKRGRMRLPTSSVLLKKDKYTPTVMALVSFCHKHDISLKRWCLAQARLITVTQFFTLYSCFGEKAFKRYLDWEAKEQRKALRADEVARSTTSAYDVIRHSIIANHENAIKWIPTLNKIKPPSIAAALLYMFPQVSGWYLIAHAEFREDVLDARFCTDPHLLKLYKRYKNSQNVRQICADTLREAIAQLGPLRW
jgi:hypothetical protein